MPEPLARAALDLTLLTGLLVFLRWYHGTWRRLLRDRAGRRRLRVLVSVEERVGDRLLVGIGSLAPRRPAPPTADIPL